MKRQHILPMALGWLLWNATPTAVAADFFVEVGDILTANYLGNQVVKVDPLTGVQEPLGSFTAPMDLTLSPTGDLYVGELGGAIKRLTITNGVVTVLSPLTSLISVRGLTLGPTGDLYVTGRSNSLDLVIRLNPVTGAEAVITQEGNLSLPTGIEFLDANTLVVASFLNSSIVKVSLLDGSQTVLASGGAWIDRPWGLAVSGDIVYAGHYDSKNLNRIAASTGVITQLGVAPGFPYGLGLEADGNLLVGAAASALGQADMLVRFGPDGTVLANFNVGLRQQISGVEVSAFRIGTPPPNTAPVLDPIADRTIDEGTPLAFRVTAVDAEVPPQTLTFTLEPGAPTGATLTTAGDFSWIPAESNGPGTNTITIRVTDNGSQALSDTGSFTVVVNEVNSAPVLAPIPVQSVTAGTLLSLTLTATDSDLPAQTLTYNLDAGAETGASLSPEGVFTWTPDASQAPGTNVFTVRVTDSGSPALFATRDFTVIVNEVNVPPSIQPILPQTVDEGTLLSFAVTASDANQPAQTLSFSLTPGAPGGAAITAGGLFTWTPSEAQGPGTNVIGIRVTDNGTPSLSSTGLVQVVVREVNLPPQFDAVSDQVVRAGQSLSLLLVATDPDLPGQALAFSLGSGAPAGAEITVDGLLTFAPTPDQAGSTNRIEVWVTDNGEPPRSSPQTVTVVVPGGVAIAAGDILIANLNDGSIVRLESQTGAQETLAWFDTPTDLALSTNGWLYISQWSGIVQRLDLNTGVISAVNPSTLLSDVWGVTLGPAGELFVTSAAGDSVTRIDPTTGAETPLSEAGLLSGPYGLDLLDSTHLVVCSQYNSRVLSVSLTDGAQSVLAEAGGLNAPWGVVVSGSDVYVADFGSQAIQRLVAGGVDSVYMTGLASPEGLAVAPNGDLLCGTAGAGSHEVLRVSPQGSLLQSYSGGAVGEVAGLVVSSVQIGNSPPVTGEDVIERYPTTGTKVLISTLLANDSDSNGDTIQFVATSPGSLNGGTVTREGDWVVYLPAPGFTGDDSFTYTVTDGVNAPVTGTVQVLANPDLVPSPNLVLTDLGTGSYLLEFDGIPGLVYRIEYSVSLSLPDWLFLGSGTADAFGVFTYTDTPPPGSPQRFYRSIYP